MQNKLLECAKQENKNAGFSQQLIIYSLTPRALILQLSLSVNIFYVKVNYDSLIFVCLLV